jgi:hypothetical protein
MSDCSIQNAALMNVGLFLTFNNQSDLRSFEDEDRSKAAG